MQDLPVLACLEPLRAALDTARSAVLVAPPGAGKTTGVPPALLDEPWLRGRRIVMLEPRRVAARAAATRIAAAFGEAVGGQVGYRTRLDSKVSADTRIEVVTEGLLTRRLQSDPALPGVGLLIFDEIHERGLHGDLALALACDARHALCPALRILAMSATLDPGPVARLLDDAPIISSDGRVHPVELSYLERAERGSAVERAARGVRRALAETDGDLLVFLPGAGEIRALAATLGDCAAQVFELFGDLPAARQDRALRPDPDGHRRVVLATNIAQTSLTIEGVRAVVDLGLERRPRFEPSTGLSRLDTVAIARDAADQRAGRAGRLGPGHCYRLWTVAEHAARRPRTEPEILDADLAALALELAQWGVDGPESLDWLDPPPTGAFSQALDLLETLGAIDDAHRLTAVGRAMGRLPMHPRLARMVIAAEPSGETALACDLAALLESRDPFSHRDQERICDIEPRLEALSRHRGAGRAADAAMARDFATVARASTDYRRRVGAAKPAETPAPGAAGRLLAFAYPDRIAASAGPQRYRLPSGRGASLPPGDGLAGTAWLVLASITAARPDAKVRLAAAVDTDDIVAARGGALAQAERLYFEPREQAVLAVTETVLGDLVLASRPLADFDRDAASALLLDAIRDLGLEVLPWSADALALRARLETVRAWRPDEPWPDCSDTGLMARLDEWLWPWLAGCTRVSHLARLDLAAALGAQLDHRLRKSLDAGAPSHLAVPSGSRIRLDYSGDGAPVLSVRLQELFGLLDTPRVCWGDVPVVVHLLSPARRPVQVTSDLRSFWERGYPEVRRELSGRYPKHHWPDDPLRAAPTARARRARRR